VIGYNDNVSALFQRPAEDRRKRQRSREENRLLATDPSNRIPDVPIAQPPSSPQHAEFPALNLPIDYPRLAAHSYRGALHHVTIDGNVTAALAALGASDATTLATTLLATLQVLLFRYTGQTELAVGTMMELDPREATRAASSNLLVLRTKLAGMLPFASFLAQVHETLLAASAHQRHASEPPPMQTLFAFQSAPQSTGDADEMPASAETYPAVFSLDRWPIQPDLALLITLQQDRLHAGLCYNRNLFEAATIGRLSDHFQVLLAAIVAQPQARIADLPLLTAAERQQILIDWNATRQPYPDRACIHELFEAQVAQRPDATALCFEGSCLTYAELNRRANQLAHHLQRLNVAPESLVGICLERSLELIVGILGVFKAGGAYVPLDPHYPRERLAYMLEDAQVPLLLTQQHLLESLPVTGTQVVCLDADWPRIAQESDNNCVSGVSAQHLAYMIYTSGSSGRPKGVLVQHQGLCNLAQSEIQVNNCHAESRVLQYSSISFDGSIDEICMALAAGATLCVAPPRIVLGSELASLLREQAITISLLPPSAAASMPPEAFPQLQTVNVGGEACAEDIVARLAPGRRFVNAYGLTENTVCATVAYCEADGRKPTIGRPIANMQVYLLDTQLQPVPVGVPGEVYIGGVGLARGYRNRPDLTAERFIPHPFSDTGYPCPEDNGGARLYKTGDLARWLPDGSIDYLGRIDQQVKVRGFRIELGEIEAVLARHPAVRECVVLAREIAPGNTQLVAYVVGENQEPNGRTKNQEQRTTRENQEPEACWAHQADQTGSLASPVATRSEDHRRSRQQGRRSESLPLLLHTYMKDQLPEYMIPSAFVLLDAWPLTPNEKIDRQALPMPDLEQLMSAGELVAPRTPTEELLAGIWAGTLGINRIGVHDHFFALGGHSLLATQVLSRVRETFQLDLPLHSFFAAPTVAELAAVIESGSRHAPDLLTPIPRAARDGDLPLSFAQRRLWFLEQLETHGAAYNIPLALHLSGKLNIDALRHGLNTIVARHEALRTVFVARDGEPVQLIVQELNIDLPVRDLPPLAQAERETAILDFVNEAAQQRFDLAHGPLLRAAVLRLGPEAHVLTLTLHHIVADGWSLGVLLRELATLYRALLGSAAPPDEELPPLPIQYADYAAWQRAWLQGDVLEKQLAFWQRHIEGAPTTIHLPTDRPRPPLQTFHGARHTFDLPCSLNAALTAFNQREGVTLFMTLLAAFQSLLHRYIGQDELLIGVPIANRTRVETEPLIGFFVNTLALRANLTGNPSFRELLRRVREAALNAYAHQDLPFEQLVQVLQPERNGSHTPLIQVLFVLQNTPLAEFELPGLAITPIEDDGSSVKFDLTLDVTETADGLTAAFKYNTDLFDPSTIARMAGHLYTLLASAIAEPEQRVGCLPLLSAAERHQILDEWNMPPMRFPESAGIHTLIETQALCRPQSVAVVFEDQRLSYAELNRRANQLAHHLRRLGVGPDVPVGICLARSAEIVVALLSVLKAGGCYVPLDPAYPSERLSTIARSAGLSVFVTQATLAERLCADRARLICIDTDWHLVEPEPDSNPALLTTADNLAYVLFTSGSTGVPKGVAVAHRQLLNYLHSIQHRLALPSGAAFATVSTFAADLGNTVIFPALCGGGSLHVIAEERISEPDAFAAYMQQHAIDCIKIVPSHLAALLTAAEPACVLPHKLLVLGGEATSWDLLAQVQALKPACRILNHYGPTESTVGVLTYPVHERAADQRSGMLPLGRPLDNVHMYLLDRYGQPLPVGVPGELYIGGAQLARGYLGRPDLTAEKFLPNPFGTVPGLRLYKTGDVARYRGDGAIEFLGRIDHQIKIRGFRIELGEIEAALLRAPNVREAVVVARTETPNTPYLVAYVVAAQNKEQSIQEQNTPNAEAGGSSGKAGLEGAGRNSDLRAFLREELPDYMIPSVIVSLAALPLTPNGKIDRRALPEPDPQGIDRVEALLAPRDTLELSLVQIWEDLLNISPISVTDNFFDLGGHSLLAVRLMSKIRDRLGQQLPLPVLFQGATIQELATLLRQRSNHRSQSPLVALQPQGALPPFFCVHPVGGSVLCYIDLARQLGTDRPFYAFQAPGIEGEQEPSTRLEDLAARYLAALRGFQPEGPYLLGGWSMGGIVAFEMAQQLRAQGVSAVKLVLIDSFVSERGMAETDAAGALPISFGAALGLDEAALEAELLGQCSAEQQLRTIVNMAQRARLLTPDVDLVQIRRWFRVYQANMQAMHAYEPRPFAGRLTLLKASEQPPNMNPAAAWARLAAEGVVTHEVPGTHFSLIKKPQVVDLAARLRSWLESAAPAELLREREAHA
jgi:amino acid adenylation domain-containing protein